MIFYLKFLVLEIEFLEGVYDYYVWMICKVLFEFFFYGVLVKI